MRNLKISKSITNREEQSLEKYLQEIAKVDLISIEEEVVLAKRIKEGDVEALEKLSKANLRFVVSVAKQYQHQGLSLSDLISEGNLGLMKAALRFDETRGFKFISYAVWWLRQTILQALSEHSRVVRMPMNKIGTYNKLFKASLAFEQKFGREPTNEELSEETHIGLKEIGDIFQNVKRHVSTDAPISEEDGGKNLWETLEGNEQATDHRQAYSESLKIDIGNSLGSLNEDECKVIQLFFGLGRSHPLRMEEVAKELNLTKERIRQIREKALMKLRRATTSEKLRKYLGQ